MVSNTLEMKLQDLLGTLKRMRKNFAQDPDYQEIRCTLPKDWPL